MKVSIAGGSGYAGGELIRLLLGHPDVELGQVTAESAAGQFVHSVHPNLRGRVSAKFVPLAELAPCDLLFLALPHGMAMGRIDEFAKLAPHLIDLSADFRLRRAEDYPRWYEREHPTPEWLSRFVYGIPELHREEIRGASYATGAGCNATATILGLKPLFERGLVERAIVEVKVGSSEGGNTPSLSSHHPERSGALRSFAPTGHRHVAEMQQELAFHGTPEVHFSATAVELVRGILMTAHCFTRERLTDKDMWRIYREAYGGEPFIRLVKERKGLYRFPEPKILAGSNFCDVGFEVDPSSNRVVVISAIDNLVKGAAGNCVQAMNVMCGFPETAGLEFTGLHP
jgi:LysW-gamma-L-alpha-aminoadipyl-6-phosphate/LysW-L-glutamyl-5-phosphate reductase